MRAKTIGKMIKIIKNPLYFFKKIPFFFFLPLPFFISGFILYAMNDTTF